MGIRDKVLIAVLAFVVLISLSSNAQAKAVLSGTTINIWSSGISRWVDTCDTLKTDINNINIVNYCSSNFASTCISVSANLNITRGGATNWTNFTVNGCEIRMNMTADGMINITSWGNFTVIKSKITTNNSAMHSAIIIKANSNFSMTNSFVSEMGWGAQSQSGIALNSPMLNFNNNTLTKCYQAIGLLGGSSGSVITNVTARGNTRVILIEYSSNNVIEDIDAASPSDPNSNFCIWLSNAANNNTLRNINASYCSGTAFYMAYNKNNTIINANADYATSTGGIYVLSGNNHTFINVTANKNSGYGISAGSYSNLINVTANNNAQYGISAGSSSNLINVTANSNAGTYGIYVGSSSTLINVTANNNAGTYGIYASSSTLTNVTANNNAGTYGIYASSSNLTNIVANNNSYGVQLAGSSTLTNLLAQSSVTSALYISGSGNVVSNASLWNCSSKGVGCILITGSNNNLSAISAVNAAKPLVYMTGANNTITDAIMLESADTSVVLPTRSSDCINNNGGLTSCSDLTSLDSCGWGSYGCNWHYCYGTLTGNCGQITDEDTCNYDTNYYCYWDSGTCVDNGLTNCEAVYSTACAYLTGCTPNVCDGTLTGSCSNIGGGTYCDDYTNGKCQSGYSSLWTSTFLNASYASESVEGGMRLVRQWYLDANVVLSGQPVDSANVTIRNSSQSLINYSYTNSAGWIQRLMLTAYVNNSGITNQWQPYNFSAFASSGSVSNQNENLNSNRVVTVTLNAPCTPVCTGKQCGDNGCGGFCPPGCESGYTCSEPAGTCVENQQPPPGGGSTPGFEPSLLALIFAALFAALFSLRQGTR